MNIIPKHFPLVEIDELTYKPTLLIRNKKEIDQSISIIKNQIETELNLFLNTNIYSRSSKNRIQLYSLTKRTIKLFRFTLKFKKHCYFVNNLLYPPTKIFRIVHKIIFIQIISSKKNLLEEGTRCLDIGHTYNHLSEKSKLIETQYYLQANIKHSITTDNPRNVKGANFFAKDKNFVNNTLILQTSDEVEFLKTLLTKSFDYRVLIDAGGVMRDLSQKQVVQIIFETSQDWQPAVKGVSFYNNGRYMLWEREDNAPKPIQAPNFKLEELFIYIDQSHAVGTDTHMSPSAKGICTLSQTTEKMFFLNAVQRMRFLNKGQIIKIVTSQKDVIGLKQGPFSKMFNSENISSFLKSKL